MQAFSVVAGTGVDGFSDYDGFTAFVPLSSGLFFQEAKTRYPATSDLNRLYKNHVRALLLCASIYRNNILGYIRTNNIFESVHQWDIHFGFGIQLHILRSQQWDLCHFAQWSQHEHRYSGLSSFERRCPSLR